MPKGAREPMNYYIVTGMEKGPALQQSDEAENWTDVPGAGAVTFYELEGKSVDTLRHDGRIMRITADERFGLLTADSELNLLQNLMIRIGEYDAYAKVLNAEGTGYRICFTAKPDHLAELLAKTDD